MVKKKTTFAEDIANLLTPAPEPEIDPERENLEEVAVLVSSDDEILDLAGKPAKGVKKPRLRGSIDLGRDEKEYTGKRSSRRDFFGAERAEEENHVPSYEDESDDVSSEEGMVSSQEEEESSEDDMNDEVKRLTAVDQTGVHSEAELLEKEMMQVEEAEAEVAEELKDRAKKEYRKAKCVKNQKRLWNATLELRIMMQKVVQGANKLPLSDMHPFLDDVDSSLSKDMDAVSADARSTLGDMCALLDALSENNPSISSQSKKRKIEVDSTIEQCWKALENRYQSFIPFRDSSLDRWHRKTMLTSGTKSTLKILNQGISKQVELLMKDEEKIAERSRVPMNQFKGLCQLETAQENGIIQGEDEGDAAGKELHGEPETYQDGEFYQALLSEFLESSTSQLTQKLHKEPKNRKIVDRRASKGRKIRYHVHEKLVNFMTPDEADVPEYASRIFANLFGHRRPQEG